MRSPGDLHPARQPVDAPRLERMEECPVSFFRYLYTEVGRAYHWVDRLSWSDERVRAHLGDPDVSVWLLSSRGAPAGYFELRRHGDASIEIAYFGLLPEFVGRGWGGHLLTEAVRAAWAALCTFSAAARSIRSLIRAAESIASRFISLTRYHSLLGE